MTTTLHELVEENDNMEAFRDVVGQAVMQAFNPFTGQTHQPAKITGNAKVEYEFGVAPELLPGGMGRVITINEVGDDAQGTV